jgi:uncharacterized protein YhaN
MRFEALSLEKYGTFDARDVALTGPGLVIVYGANEAGKSSCLTAISDLLFGIPHNSSMGGFGYDQMRIGAALRCADGRELVLRRRKGRNRTLTDARGEPLDDAVLSPLLGATDRERFGRLFGLDHHNLRAGGEQLLAADGEIGRLIVEAGGGLRTLMARLDALDAEADSLFSPKRAANRAFYQALDAYSAADGEHRAAVLSRDTYEAARRTRDQSHARVASLRAEKQELGARVSRLQRLIRVTPLLSDLAQLEAALAGYAEVEGLPEEFDTRWADLRRRREDADRARDQTREQHAILRGRLDKLIFDESVVSAGPAIKDVGERAILIAKQRQDRPNREKELADAETQLMSLRERLRVAAAEDLAARLPSEADVEAVQRLALEAIERRPRLAEAERALAQTRDRLTRLSDLIAQSLDTGHDATWGVTASAFSSLVAQAAAVTEGLRQLEAARRALADDASRLGAGDLEDLRRLVCPQPSAVQAEAAARERLETERTRQLGLKIAADAEREASSAEIERLRRGGEVPTDEVLARARQVREAAWRPIREAHLSGASSQPDAERRREVDSFGQSLAAADDLADRRTSEAQRIAGLVEAERRRSEAEAGIRSADASVAQIGKDLGLRQAEFAAAFEAVCSLQPALPALQTFLTSREALLARDAELSRRAAELEAQHASLAPTLDLLSAVERVAGLAPMAETTLTDRVQTAVAAMTRHAEDQTELQRLQRERLGLEATLDDQTRFLAQLRSAQEAWASAWDAPVAALGAGAGLAPEAAASLANQWATARGVLTSVGQTRRRLQRMDEDAADLAHRVNDLATQLTVEPPADPMIAAEWLGRRWRAEEECRVERRGLEPELQALEVRLQARDQACGAVLAEIESLAQEAMLSEPDDAALSEIARSVSERARLLGERAQLMATLRSAGDGFELQTLLEQQEGRDLDGLRGELAEAESRLAALDGDVEDAIRAEKTAADTLAGYERDNVANHALAVREAATARMHGVLERYVELKVARELISGAIARVRNEQQDPLVRRAGELFAATTKGRFTGVATDVDANGAPVVVGVREGGGAVAVSAMSDGTRDQLFLAFRLASLETYCRSTEPLPFIADDILVHFDDARSAATLELLADFSPSTQVLLFTHHQSICRAAEPLVAAGRATLVELDQRA